MEETKNIMEGAMKILGRMDKNQVKELMEENGKEFI